MGKITLKLSMQKFYKETLYLYEALSEEITCLFCILFKEIWYKSLFCWNRHLINQAAKRPFVQSFISS